MPWARLPGPRRVGHSPYTAGMSDERLQVTCHCGWNVTGTKAEVIAETQDHALKVHWADADEEDILEMAVPAP